MKLGIKEFFEDIANFVKSGTVMGIDIGTTTIKIAEISRKKERYRLENYCLLETKSYLNHPNQAIQTSTLKMVDEEVLKLLKVALAEMKPKTDIVMVSLPAFAVFVTTFDMPILSPEETKKSVAFQAKQYIPLPLSEVTIEWVKVGEYDTQRGQRNQQILLIGIPNELVERYKTIFKQAGLKLASIEIEHYPLLRVLSAEELGVLMIVDIGAESTNVVIGEKGVLKYAGQTDYGGRYLTQAISRGLDISMIRAEELKKRRGLSRRGPDSELSTLILPFLDVIIQEVRRIQRIYEEHHGKTVEKVVCVGGGSKMIGVEEYVKSQLNVPYITPATLKGIEYPTELEPVIRGIRYEMAIPVGLIKKYFE